MKHIPNILKGLREEREYTQKQVADCLGISQQAYSNYETDKREIPVRHIARLAEFYGVSADYLIGLDPSCDSTDRLNEPYTSELSLKDILYNLQSLQDRNRETAAQYIMFLKREQRRRK